MEKCYKIAGVKVRMNTFGRTESQSLPYMMKDCKDVDITIQSDMEYIRKLYPNMSEDGCEYMASGRDFYIQLLNFNGLMIHSSALVMNGKAYLFSADCGTGKSTHVCLWRRVFGDENVRVLNDDKPAVRLENGVWYAYGTPWCGKTAQNANIRVPLGGIAVLERGEKNEIEPFGGRKAMQAIFAQTSILTNRADYIKQLDLLDQLMSEVPIWKLRCNMEPEAAIVAYEAMSGEKWRVEE